MKSESAFDARETVRLPAKAQSAECIELRLRPKPILHTQLSVWSSARSGQLFFF
jgi:hypothetical protein